MTVRELVALLVPRRLPQCDICFWSGPPARYDIVLSTVSSYIYVLRAIAGDNSALDALPSCGGLRSCVHGSQAQQRANPWTPPLERPLPRLSRQEVELSENSKPLQFLGKLRDFKFVTNEIKAASRLKKLTS